MTINRYEPQNIVISQVGCFQLQNKDTSSIIMESHEIAFTQVIHSNLVIPHTTPNMIITFVLNLYKFHHFHQA